MRRIRDGIVNGVALGIAAACLISLTNVFSRLHFEAGSNPVTFLLGRYLIVVTVLALGLAAFRRIERVPAARRADLLVAGLANVTGGGCLAFAIERIEVSLAVIILYLFPLITLLMSSALHRERPPVRMLAALAVAFAGLFLALDIGGDAPPPDPIGIGFAIAAATSIALSFVWIERRLGAVADGTRLLWLTGVGLVAAIVLALSSGDVVWPLPRPDGWSTLLAATAGFGAASATMFLAVSRIGASATAMLMNLEPPVTALFAVLLVGDTLSAVQVVGIAIVLAAVFAAQRLGRAAPVSNVPPR